MLEVLNYISNYILVILDRRVLLWERGLDERIFVMITSMTSILKLVKNPKTRKEVVR